MKAIIDLYKTNYEFTLPKLESKKVRILWHQGYHDGPLDGVCEYNGDKCWFEQIGEGPGYEEFIEDAEMTYTGPGPRQYVIVKLTNEQFSDIFLRHEKYQKMVGTHCDYTYNSEGYASRNFFGGDEWVTKESMAQYFKDVKNLPPLPPLQPESGIVYGWVEWEWSW